MKNEELPQLGTPEFNDLASACFGGKPKPKKETLEASHEYELLQHIKMCIQCKNEAHAIRILEKYSFAVKEQMYSEEEVLKILLAKNVDLGIIGKTSEVKEWFEQFKK